MKRGFYCFINWFVLLTTDNGKWHHLCSALIQSASQFAPHSRWWQRATVQCAGLSLKSFSVLSGHSGMCTGGAGELNYQLCGQWTTRSTFWDAAPHYKLQKKSNILKSTLNAQLWRSCHSSWLPVGIVMRHYILYIFDLLGRWWI